MKALGAKAKTAKKVPNLFCLLIIQASEKSAWSLGTNFSSKKISTFEMKASFLVQNKASIFK